MEIAPRRREQEVWQACDDLWSMHGDIKNLTGDVIRERLVVLGKSRGSPNEIYKYRKSWIKSRQVGLSTTTLEDDVPLDPISRAVRMVHEQLKSEANAQILALEENCAELLRQKEAVLIDTKNALDKVMEEFSYLEKELHKATARIKILDEERLLEIDLRKAMEKELILNKSLFEQEKKAHHILVNELKEVYKNEMDQTKIREQQLITSADGKINALIDEKRALGHEYSEKLNDMKVVIYNHEIAIKQMEQKLASSMQEIKSLNNVAQEENQKMEKLSRDNATISSALLYSQTELEHVRADKYSCEMLFKKETLLRKKSELTIARLRAIFNKNPERL